MAYRAWSTLGTTTLGTPAHPHPVPVPVPLVQCGQERPWGSIEDLQVIETEPG